MSDVRLIGIGNPLRGDDGVGIVAVEQLRQWALPADVELVDGGTGGLTLLSLLEGARRAILVDAVDMNQAPGTVIRFGLDDLLPLNPTPLLSQHAAGALPALHLGRELGLLPPLVFFGVQVATTEPGLGLSPALAAALPELLAALLAELTSPV